MFHFNPLARIDTKETNADINPYRVSEFLFRTFSKLYIEMIWPFNFLSKQELTYYSYR